MRTTEVLLQVISKERPAGTKANWEILDIIREEAMQKGLHYDLLEEKQPKALIAVTGKNPMCGLKPFPIFEDGNFTIPSAYIDKDVAGPILEQDGDAGLKINSKVNRVKSGQPIITKHACGTSKGKVVLCAHMDTKYGTPGAIDNATGVAVLIASMERLNDYNSEYDIEFVPFNSEEYYEVKGQLLYLDYIKNNSLPLLLAVNIDGSCNKGSQTAVSSYNLDNRTAGLLPEEINDHKSIVSGPEWYSLSGTYLFRPMRKGA